MKVKKFTKLKSHDCHVLMTQLLPVIIRGIFPDNVQAIITKLCAFMNAISQKIIDPDSLIALENDVVQCLVSFEMIFLPFFFNIMTHLLCHLVKEIRILGPVYLHNMFPFERYMVVLKKYVRNHSRPEQASPNAKELVHTDSIEDQLIGFRILEHMLRCNKMYQRMARKKIRASPGTIQMAVHKLGSKRDTDEDVRGHAALILLELAPDLQVDSFPGVLTAISSLLGTKKEDITSGSFSSPTNVSKEFQLLGLQILEKLADNPENCAKVNDAKDHLIPRVIHHTSCIGGRMDCEIDMEIVHTSLKTLHKLVTTAGEAADELRRQVSKDPRFMENIRKIIIGHTEGQPQLLVQATGILALLALDCTARNEIERSRGIIQKLISFLAGEIDAVEDHILRKLQGSASEALVLLATPFKEREKIVLSTVSESSVQAILAETKLEDMENIVHILYNESAEHRIIVGKLLHNLRAYRGAEFAELLKKIDQALPKVLQIIKLSVERVESDSSNEHASHELREQLYSSKGKLLESFIGLTVQICTNNDEMFFTDALTTANITVDMFMQKINKTLAVYKSPTADFPGIRRVVIQQMDWMMQKKLYIVEFKKHEMDMILKETKETTTIHEIFLFFHSGVGVFEHDEHISSIVNKSLKLIDKLEGYV